MYEPELRFERESSREEKRHEAMRIALTYSLLNITTIVMIHLLIAPILSPHEFNTVISSKDGIAVFKAFCAIWALITAFYNFMLGWCGYRWLIKKWKREMENTVGHWNRYRNPKSESAAGGGDEEMPKVPSPQEHLEPALGSKAWFANNNPYTAARRTHSGTFAAVRRGKRFSYPVEHYRTYIEPEPILEETGECEVDPEIEIWHDAFEEKDRNISDARIETVDGRFRVGVNYADAYPFPKDEIEGGGSSTTTWSNSATSARELARKRRSDKDAKKENPNPEVGNHRTEEFACSSPTCGKAKFEGIGSELSSIHSSNKGSSSSRPCDGQGKHSQKPTDQENQVSSGEGSSNISSEHVEMSKELKSTTESSESEELSEERGRPKSTANSQPERNQSPQDSFNARSRAVKDIMTYGSYHDQQAATHYMNQAIWSEIGEHMERQALRIQEPPRPEKTIMQAKLQSQQSSRRWWDLKGEKKAQKEFKMVDFKDKEPDFEKKNSSLDGRRRYLIVAIGFTTILMTLLPPFLAIGGEIIAHDFQFQHACDRVRWDIRLDSSGLHPEQNNIYNRATFKDRRGKGYEKEFMMNLEGMSTYGNGLDFSLVNQRRGYVFYLSDRDLANQPDGGESVKFPYPVVVAYDMLKHTYYAHDDIWKDLNDESFFDNGAFMNGTMGIFPSEGIWLEKKEKDGYCGQPKRVLKNGYDQRIIWTVVDSRTDCTVLRVCASGKATRRQVVIATGMILLRLTMSATCCSKGSGDAEPVGT
ncbi:hypothetical protein H072_10419 [Dactylellina haptotyla CBS 200.50]|uniref:Uncharacterized protein n=1 Tax=Dactylellina haptotyla (strain CBS 200.50) TaxID=1284197 RepID=S8A4K4_DACHA|nr:hypothetical protein H072_10419 [Dactylellina haptotyla CBS 200.50]